MDGRYQNKAQAAMHSPQLSGGTWSEAPFFLVNEEYSGEVTAQGCAAGLASAPCSSLLSSPANPARHSGEAESSVTVWTR